MSFPPPKPEVEDDKSSLLSAEPGPSRKHAKSPDGTRPEQQQDEQLRRPPHYLSPLLANRLRVPSPDGLSVISLDDASRTGRTPAHYLTTIGSHRHASRSPAPLPVPRTRRGRAAAWWKEGWARNKGVALVLIAQVFATLMNVTAQILEIDGNGGKGFNPFQILFARMTVTTLLSSLYMWWSKTEGFPLGPKGVRLLLVARGIGGFFGVFGMYYSLIYLPLADATVITFLSPSLACFACSFFIDEPFTRMEQIAALVSFFGVVLIARPTSLFSSSGSDSSPPASGNGDVVPSSSTTLQSQSVGHGGPADVTPAQRAAAVGVAMVGVLGAAVAYTTIRWIGRRAHPLLSVNYFAAWCTIVSTVVLLTVPGVDFLLPTNAKDWALLSFLGVCGFIMQFLLAAGLQHEKSSRATNMVYTQMFFALAFDKLVWGATPGVLSIAGSSLILGSAMYVAMRKDTAKSKETISRPSANVDEERRLMDETDTDRTMDEGVLPAPDAQSASTFAIDSGEDSGGDS